MVQGTTDEGYEGLVDYGKKRQWNGGKRKQIDEQGCKWVKSGWTLSFSSLAHLQMSWT